MRARLLRKILNNTEYSVSNHIEYIAIGSALVHDLISVNKKTLKLKYALDTFNEGRDYLVRYSNLGNELLFIWDKLQEIINDGSILDIIQGRDNIENPLPVYTVVDGSLIESFTDKYGWPNTDDNGIIMYDNTHFPTKEQAIEYGLKEYKAKKRFEIEKIQRIESEILNSKKEISIYDSYISSLNSISTNPKDLSSPE